MKMWYIVDGKDNVLKTRGDIIMKKILVAALAASMILLVGCGNNAEKTQDESKNVVPKEASISIDHLDAADFPTSFDASSLKESDGTLSLETEVYDEELFDAVEITTLAKGDKITADGQEYTVETVEKSESGLISVNGGLEQGGIDFATNDSEGGVYYVEGLDDTHTYADLGKVTLTLADNFTFTDNSDLDNPEQKYDADGFKKLLADDPNSYGFSQFNTKVTVEGGVITGIERNFRP